MTIAVDLGRKATKHTNKNQILLMQLHSHQTMLIYMNKNLKLLNHLASEFNHS